MEVLRPRVEAADTLLLVTEACADGLRDVQHVGHIVPAVRVVNSRQVFSETAGSILFKQADQTVRSRTAIEPKREGIRFRLVARFKEPVENMDLDRIRENFISVESYIHLG